MPQVFIAVGSNIKPAENVRAAIRLLGREVRLKAVSTIYCTEPEGRPDQPLFYNGVVEVDTDLPPEELKCDVLKPIEEALGRTRCKDQYAPRTIDLDIAIYGDLVIEENDLIIPDPLIERRAFLAVPLYELAPDLILPDSGMPIRDIANAYAGHSMKPLLEYTEMLRKEIEDGSRKD